MSATATPAASAAVTEFVTSGPVAGAPDVVTVAAVDELDREARRAAALRDRGRLGKPAVDRVRKRFDYPGLGDGIRALEAANPALAGNAYMDSVGRSGKVPELDQAAMSLSSQDLAALSTKLVEAMGAGGAAQAKEVARLLAEVTGGGSS